MLYSVLWTVCSLSCLFRPAWWWHFTSLFGSSLDSTVLLLDHSSTTTTTIPTISIGSGMRPLLLNCELCSSSDAALHHHQHSAPQLDCLFSFSFSPFCLSVSLIHSPTLHLLPSFIRSSDVEHADCFGCKRARAPRSVLPLLPSTCSLR